MPHSKPLYFTKLFWKYTVGADSTPRVGSILELASGQVLLSNLICDLNSGSGNCQNCNCSNFNSLMKLIPEAEVNLIPVVEPIPIIDSTNSDSDYSISVFEYGWLQLWFQKNWNHNTSNVYQWELDLHLSLQGLQSCTFILPVWAIRPRHEHSYEDCMNPRA